MMRYFHADAGTSGNTISTSDTASGTAWNTVNGAPIYSSSAAKVGANGIRIPSGTGTIVDCEWTGEDSLSMATQFWFKWVARPAAQTRVVALKNANTVGGILSDNATDKLGVMQSTSLLSGSLSPALTPGNWYFIDLAITNGTGGAGSVLFDLYDSGGTRIHNYSNAFTGPNANNITSALYGRILTSSDFNGAADYDEIRLAPQAALMGIIPATTFNRHIIIG